MRYNIKHTEGYEVVEMSRFEDAELYGRIKYGQNKFRTSESRWAKHHPQSDITLNEERLLLTDGYEDVSWHNDELPSFIKDIDKMTGKIDGVGIHIWVSSEDDSPRFSVQLYDVEQGDYLGEEYHTHDIAYALGHGDVLKRKFDDKAFENAVITDMIKVMTNFYINDAEHYDGSEEEIASSNLLYAYAEKCGLWSDDDTDQHGHDDPITRLEVLKEKLSRY